MRGTEIRVTELLRVTEMILAHVTVESRDSLSLLSNNIHVVVQSFFSFPCRGHTSVHLKAVINLSSGHTI